MHAIQLDAVGAPLVDRDVPVPEPGPEDALLRVRAAGICRSDLHYTTGASYAGPLPLTLGHEVAGTLESAGSEAASTLADRGIEAGSRVAVHYLVSCGNCSHCIAGREQFCNRGQMIGKHRDGGMAEYLCLPARNLVAVPESVALEAAAVMMCSTATALHALRKAELAAGDRVAVFGVGGLGMSAVQLARAMGAIEVYAVDVDGERLELARTMGAVPINARETDPVAALRDLTAGGVDCAVELLGLPVTIDQAIRSLGPLGRVAIAGIAETPVSIETYRDVVGREAKIVGVSDHTRGEIEYALELAAKGALRFEEVVTATLPLEASAVNGALASLARFGPGVRSVVVPA
ncbi:MAG: alcohol dehydrogenase catalytic domain-containing protein [Spirochaetaceae bacterium]